MSVLVDLHQSAETRARVSLASAPRSTGDVSSLLVSLEDLEALERARPVAARVLRDESAYRPDGQHSWARDLALREAGDVDATARLERHARQAGDVLALERRDISTSTLGGIVPPAWVLDLVESSGAPDVPLSSILSAPVPLPATGSEIVLPRFSTAASAGASAENALPTESNPATTGTPLPISPVWAYVDISTQVLERGGPAVDLLVATELRDRSAEELERLIVAGSGTGGEFTGIVNLSGITTEAYTAASADAAGLGAAAAKLSSAVSSQARRIRARWLVAHPRRLDVLLGGTRSNELTITPPEATDPAGTLCRWAGLAILPSSGIEATFGAGDDEDRLLVVAPGAGIVLVGAPQVIVSNNGTGTVRLTTLRYCAFVPQRPAGFGVLTGTGLLRTL